MKWTCSKCGAGPYNVEPHELPVHHFCDTELPTAEQAFIEALPEATRKRMGDRAKEFFEWFGVPPCGGCSARQAWLNEIDKKLFG